jgi:hypothetical protein
MLVNKPKGNLTQTPNRTSVGSFGLLNEISDEQSKEIMDNFKAIINTRLDQLYNTKGADGELYAYGIAVNQVKKKAEQPEEASTTEEQPTEEPMDKETKLKEMIQAALSKPLSEKKKSSNFTPEYDDKFDDKRKDLPDGLQKAILKKQGNLNEGVADEIENYFNSMIKTQPEDALALIMDLVKNDGKNWGEWIDNIQADIVDTYGGDYKGDIRGYREELEEDLDLGHQDDEPHMIKGELYKIAQNALALYNMLKPFDKLDQEVDLPAWWQSKITKACTMLGSAKNYLEFELKEPQIDAMADMVNEEDVIDEKLKPSMGAGAYVDDFRQSDAPQFKGKSKKKKQKMAVAAYLSAKDKIKEAILAKLKDRK